MQFNSFTLFLFSTVSNVNNRLNRIMFKVYISFLYTCTLPNVLSHQGAWTHFKSTARGMFCITISMFSIGVIQKQI